MFMVSLNLYGQDESVSLNVYVNPHEQLSDYIIKLTGITQKTVDEGIDFKEALKEFWASLKSKRVVSWGTDGELLVRDSKNLGVDIPNNVQIINLRHTAELLRFSQSGKKPGGLKSTMELFGLEFLGQQHNAVIDALNTARLVREFVHGMQIYNYLKKNM